VSDKLIVEKTAESSEWPKPLKDRFFRLCLLANELDFNVLGIVGLDMKAARAGEVRVSAIMSPRASTNPHRAELCEDIARLFQAMAERSKQ
jgi:hypothetical protein